MSALKSIKRERFCRSLASKILAGEAQADARLAAYVETIYQGDNPQGIAVGANARRLVNQADVKARLEELVLRDSSRASDDIATNAACNDPLIIDVLKRLPPPGTVWPEARRKVWLRLIEESFEIVYRGGPSEADNGQGGVARETILGTV
jgi:hypothetical protein